MQWVFDKRRAFGEQASHLSLVSSGADGSGRRWTTTALVALAAREVAEAIPGARDAVLRRGTVIREKRATFSLAPGQPPRPGLTTPVRGLFLAGDWIDTGLPGTIESAALAGHRAARACLGQASIDGSISFNSSAGSRNPREMTRKSSRPTGLCHNPGLGRRHEIRRRPLPGDRAQGEEPAVVRRAAGPQHPARRRRTSTSPTSAC